MSQILGISVRKKITVQYDQGLYRKNLNVSTAVAILQVSHRSRVPISIDVAVPTAHALARALAEAIGWLLVKLPDSDNLVLCHPTVQTHIAHTSATQLAANIARQIQQQPVWTRIPIHIRCAKVRWLQHILVLTKRALAYEYKLYLNCKLLCQAYSEVQLFPDEQWPVLNGLESEPPLVMTINKLYCTAAAVVVPVANLLQAIDHRALHQGEFLVPLKQIINTDTGVYGHRLMYPETTTLYEVAFGQVLAYLRLIKEVAVDTLAAVMNIPPSDIVAYEQNAGLLPAAILYKYCVLFCVTPMDLHRAAELQVPEDTTQQPYTVDYVVSDKDYQYNLEDL